MPPILLHQFVLSGRMELTDPRAMNLTLLGPAFASLKDIRFRLTAASQLDLVAVAMQAASGLQSILIDCMRCPKYHKTPLKQHWAKLSHQLSGVRRLSVMFFIIPEWPTELFSSETRMEYLSIEYDEMQRLPVQLPRTLQHLKNLSLCHNSLSDLPEGLFRQVAGLETLALSHNRLNFLPEKTFQNLSRLKHLNLGANLLSALPVKIFQNLSALQTLFLDKNKLPEAEMLMLQKHLGRILHRVQDEEGGFFCCLRGRALRFRCCSRSPRVACPLSVVPHVGPCPCLPCFTAPRPGLLSRSTENGGSLGDGGMICDSDA